MKKNIATDISNKSLLDYGTNEFRFAYFYDEICQYQENSINWHWHNGLEFSFVISGPIDCYVGDKREILEAGDICFINQAAIHRFTSHSGGLMVNCIFSQDFLSPIGSRIYTDYIVPIISSGVQVHKVDRNTAEGMEMIKEIVRVHNELEIKSPTWEIQVKSGMLKIWGLLYRLFMKDLNGEFSQKPKLHNKSHSRLMCMLNYIHNHFKEKISLDEIADATNISKSEALRCFKEGLDTTPVVYLTQYRLSQAKDMLLKNEKSVRDIAIDCGFDNSSYFCKVFKKNEGITPKEFCEKYAEIYK